MSALLKWLAKNAEKLSPQEIEWFKRYAQRSRDLEHSWAIPNKLKMMTGAGAEGSAKEWDYINQMYRPDQLNAGRLMEQERRSAPGKIGGYWSKTANFGPDDMLIDEGMEALVRSERLPDEGPLSPLEIYKRKAKV